eukprot:scaffold403_cov241-Pinguiococcus_pyrenoidosus.AAC.2
MSESRYIEAWANLEESLQHLDEDLAYTAMRKTQDLKRADKTRRNSTDHPNEDAMAKKPQEMQIEVIEDVRSVVEALKALKALKGAKDDMPEQHWNDLMAAIREDVEDAGDVAATLSASWRKAASQSRGGGDDKDGAKGGAEQKTDSSHAGAASPTGVEPDSSSPSANVDVKEDESKGPQADSEHADSSLEAPSSHAQAQAPTREDAASRFEEYLRQVELNDFSDRVPHTMILVPRDKIHDWCANMLPEGLEYWPSRSSFGESIRWLKRSGRTIVFREQKYRAFAVCPVSMKPMPSNGGKGFPVWFRACEPTDVERFVYNHPCLVAAVCAAAVGAGVAVSAGALTPFLALAILAPGAAALEPAAAVVLEKQLEDVRCGPSVLNVQQIQDDALADQTSGGEDGGHVAISRLNWVPFWTHREYAKIRDEINSACGKRSNTPDSFGLRVVERRAQHNAELIDQASCIRLFVRKEEEDAFRSEGVGCVHEKIQFYDYAMNTWVGWREGVPDPLE